MRKAVFKQNKSWAPITLLAGQLIAQATAILSLFLFNWSPLTLGVALFVYCSIMLGITMGYHRLFSHKSYQTNTFVEWVLMIFGSLALENTILKWSSDHRKHHSFSETEDDPYSIVKGFWHAHIGWVVKNTSEEKSRIIGVKDLKNKSAIIYETV